VAQAAQRDDRQIEAAPVVGDEVRSMILGEASKVGQHTGFVLVLADDADALERVVLVEPQRADDDRPMRPQRRERRCLTGRDLGRRVEVAVGDRLDVEDQVAARAHRRLTAGRRR
jgi:hypothetical protein